MNLSEWHQKFLSTKQDIRFETTTLHLTASAARRIFMRDLANELDAIAHSVEEAVYQLDQATGSMIRDGVNVSISAMHETLVACVTGAIEHVAGETKEEKSNERG